MQHASWLRLVDMLVYRDLHCWETSWSRSKVSLQHGRPAGVLQRVRPLQHARATDRKPVNSSRLLRLRHRSTERLSACKANPNEDQPDVRNGFGVGDKKSSAPSAADAESDKSWYAGSLPSGFTMQLLACQHCITASRLNICAGPTGGGSMLWTSGSTPSTCRCQTI